MILKFLDNFTDRFVLVSLILHIVLIFKGQVGDHLIT